MELTGILLDVARQDQQCATAHDLVVHLNACADALKITRYQKAKRKEKMKRNMQNHKNPRVIPSHLLLGALLLIFHAFLQETAKSVCASADSQPPIVEIPPGLKAMGPPEVFGPHNLYEKIDGQAELYLSAGFTGLTFQWFSEKEDPGSWVEVSIYHMGDRTNAFSVYSMQRRENARKVDLVQFAYKTENALYLVHGPYYIEVIAATPSERVLSKMLRLAENFVNDTAVDRKPIEGLDFFPPENLDKDSITMIARNAFGYDGLDRVFTAIYTIDGGRVTAFISKRKMSREAKDLVRGLHQFLKTFDGRDIHLEGTVQNVKMVEIMDTFYTVFSNGVYLAGVYEASTRKQAEKLSEFIAKKLRKMMDSK